jgi:putative transposase
MKLRAWYGASYGIDLDAPTDFWPIFRIEFADGIMLALVDGLKGFPDAITAVFPDAVVQTSIAHLLRNSMGFVSWKDRKPLATVLKGIYRAVDAETALSAFEVGGSGRRYPAIGQSWRRVWSEVISFCAFPQAVRRIIYTTNAIEALNSRSCGGRSG